MLADDIGIIDHGALLEEESLAELEQKSNAYIRFAISDTAQAAKRFGAWICIIYIFHTRLQSASTQYGTAPWGKL